jgi:hypothetical protein
MGKFALVVIASLLTFASAEARSYRGHYAYHGGGGTAAAANFQDQFKNTY